MLKAVLQENDALDVDPDEITVEIAFTDASGVRWHRSVDGALQEVLPAFELPGEAIDERAIPVTDN